MECPYKQNNYTEQTKIFGKDKLACKVGECPYGNLMKITWGGEPIAEICNTEGKLEKLMVYSPINNFNQKSA